MVEKNFMMITVSGNLTTKIKQINLILTTVVNSFIVKYEKVFLQLIMNFKKKMSKCRRL